MNDETNETNEHDIPPHLLVLMDRLQDEHTNEPLRQLLIAAVQADPEASKDINDYLLFAGVNHVIGLHNPATSFNDEELEAALPFTSDMISSQTEAYLRNFQQMYPMIMAASPDNGLRLISEVLEKMLTSLARVTLAIGWYSGSQGKDCLFAEFHEHYDLTTIKADADEMEKKSLERLETMRQLKDLVDTIKEKGELPELKDLKLYDEPDNA